MSLDHQMTRYFEYMRPRYTNPTYASSNVGSTLGLISSTSYQKPVLRLADTNPYRQPEPQSQKAQIDNNPSKKEPSEDGRSSRGHKKSKSLMSNYGTSSLGQLPRVLNERDIYEKQQKKYNIITIQPKEYQQTIKKYPKYRLENQDQNYYKKLQLQDQYNKYQDSRVKITHQNPEFHPHDPTPLTNNSHQKSQTFRAKMLNNIDELGGVL